LGFGTKTLNYKGGQWLDLDEEPSTSRFTAPFSWITLTGTPTASAAFSAIKTTMAPRTPSNMPSATSSTPWHARRHVWFAANNTFHEGYLIRATTTGSLNVIPTEGVIASRRPVHLISLCTYPGSNSIPHARHFRRLVLPVHLERPGGLHRAIMQITYIESGRTMTTTKTDDDGIRRRR
jgi:hypothetical protein